jgi:hypothetical protein
MSVFAQVRFGGTDGTKHHCTTPTTTAIDTMRMQALFSLCACVVCVVVHSATIESNDAGGIAINIAPDASLTVVQGGVETKLSDMPEKLDEETRIRKAEHNGSSFMIVRDSRVGRVLVGIMPHDLPRESVPCPRRH